MIRSIINTCFEAGGCTFSPSSGCFALSGYAVGLEGHESVEPSLTTARLEEYITGHWAVLSKLGHHVGVWYHNGMWYLDISVVEYDQLSAEILARKHHQLAFYDLKNGKEIQL